MTPQTGNKDGIPEIPIMAATRIIGHMQEFNPANETVMAYLEQFQLFVTANSVEEDKLVSTFLTVVGSEHYSLLQGLISPDLPKDKKFIVLLVMTLFINSERIVKLPREIKIKIVHDVSLLMRMRVQGNTQT